MGTMANHDPDEFKVLQRDDVKMFCPACKVEVMCTRTVYKYVVDYTCWPHKHHFTLSTGKPGDRIGGVRPPPTGPKGYGEDDT
jgi:hypothetical protein